MSRPARDISKVSACSRASYRLLDTIRFPSDADDIRYDPSRKLVYIGYGNDGHAGVGIVSASTDKIVAKIPLPRHPEAFSISPSRIFVNIPSAGNTIAVVDRRKRLVVSRWTIQAARENFPMALDRADHRLFIVTRQPARLVVFDSSSGREVTSLPCVGVADDAYYDSERKFIYISGGEGFLDVFKQDYPDHYHLVQKVRTSSGARTSLFVSKVNRLYLAVPRRGTQPAEVWV